MKLQSKDLMEDLKWILVDKTVFPHSFQYSQKNLARDLQQKASGKDQNAWKCKVIH